MKKSWKWYLDNKNNVEIMKVEKIIKWSSKDKGYKQISFQKKKNRKKNYQNFNNFFKKNFKVKNNIFFNISRTFIL